MRIALIALVALMTAGPSAETVTVYKSPTCHCCSQWVDRMKAAGFTVQTVDVENPGALQTIKRDHGITPQLGSCHTAVVGGYVVEGHVPPELVKKLLHDHPKGVTGLAVPGMPNGAPGMESPGAADHYDVLALSASGTSVYDHR
jgi:hypothetical protein